MSEGEKMHVPYTLLFSMFALKKSLWFCPKRLITIVIIKLHMGLAIQHQILIF